MCVCVCVYMHLISTSDRKIEKLEIGRKAYGYERRVFRVASRKCETFNDERYMVYVLDKYE